MREFYTMQRLRKPKAMSGWVAADAGFPGGFVEKSYAVTARNRVTDLSFVPATRGAFTFPAPYNTLGIRLTVPADGTVDAVGYSYWACMNNHVGSDTIEIHLRIAGRTKRVQYNKTTDAVTIVGDMFPAGAFQAISNESFYFSKTLPTKLYCFVAGSGTILYRYDIVTQAFTTVFDISSGAGVAAFGTNKMIWQVHSSADDDVHSFTVKFNGTPDYAVHGIGTYKESTNTYTFTAPVISGADVDECQIDHSGRWLLIKEDIDELPGQAEDNRVIDMTSVVSEQTLLDQAGAAGHSDNGYGYAVLSDNWGGYPSNIPNLLTTRNFANYSSVVNVFYTSGWAINGPGHISHLNGVNGPASTQYIVGSGAYASTEARGNEVLAIKLDGSYDTLVIAPVMTDLSSTPPADSYYRYPKGNVDVTGRYFIWTSNLEGTNLDAFIVKVPSWP